MSTFKAPYLFIVDTTSYAGNFERDLCAFVTGRTGECGVGDDMAERFKKETRKRPFSNVINEPDEHGCHRPVSIYPTPGWYNNGMGGHFADDPSTHAEALEACCRATKQYYEPLMRQLEGHMEKLQTGTPEQKQSLKKIGWTKDACKREIAHYQAEIDKVMACKKVSKSPAYLSVAISFASKPTQAQIDLMKKRAKRFSRFKERFGGGLRIDKISGFRLLHQTLKSTELAI